MWNLRRESAQCLEDHKKGRKDLSGRTRRGSGNRIEEASESRKGEVGERKEAAGGRLVDREGVGRKVEDGVGGGAGDGQHQKCVRNYHSGVCHLYSNFKNQLKKNLNDQKEIKQKLYLSTLTMIILYLKCVRK